MRVPTIASAFYAPGNPPDDPSDWKRYVQEELIKISAAVAALALGHVDKTHVAPTKPREGDIRFADGTQWNPGSGIGIYAYYSGAWNKL